MSTNYLVTVSKWSCVATLRICVKPLISNVLSSTKLYHHTVFMVPVKMKPAEGINNHLPNFIACTCGSLSSPQPASTSSFLFRSCIHSLSTCVSCLPLPLYIMTIPSVCLFHFIALPFQHVCLLPASTSTHYHHILTQFLLLPTSPLPISTSFLHGSYLLYLHTYHSTSRLSPHFPTFSCSTITPFLTVYHLPSSSLATITPFLPVHPLPTSTSIYHQHTLSLPASLPISPLAISTTLSHGYLWHSSSSIWITTAAFLVMI